jgi:CheY-like chemotaxis protein
MDVQMPEMDGLEATRKIRALPKTRSTPWIVALTANASEQDRKLCEEAGMDDYMSKPITRPALQQAMTTALANLRQRRSV